MMSSYSEQAFKEKISRLSLSQDSIETLSLWVLEHKAHAKASVQTWLGELKRADADRRLVLFYLANDILQNGRRRGADSFLDLFQDPLRQAVTMIGGQKIQTSIERMFRIWKERRLYSNAFLKELEQLIEPARRTQVNEPLPDFKLPLLQDALLEFAKFQGELKVKSSHLANLRVDISNPTSSLTMLKDKSAGGRVSQQFEEASQKLQDYCECLGIEVNERINILDMLKECKVFTTYRLTELEKTTADYDKLAMSVKEVKEKIEQRVKDLERAHSTATSDPSAREDITDIGDMEIESDGESQPDSQPDTTKSLVSNAPGMLISPPTSGYTDPRRRQPQNLPDIATRGGVYAQPLMAANIGRTQNALPFPANGPGVMSHPSQYRPVAPPQPQLHRPPNRGQRPLPPPQRFQARAPPPGMRQQRAPTSIRPPFRGPMPRPPRPSVNDNLGSGGHTFSGSPVMYRPQAVESGNQEAEQAPPNSMDTKRSLDERLKDMMMSNKFGNTMLDSVAESPPPDNKPYSPSADNPAMQPDVDIEEDRQSLPALNDDSPAEETTPIPNMDNPILKALYKSQTSPEHNSKPPPSSLVPDYDQEDNDELSASDLKNILDQVKSSELAEPMDAIAPPSTDETSLPVTAISEEQKASTKLKPPPPSDIKITPSLTSLLDEIFPKISQSLINRKRKQEETPNDSSVKMPRPSDPVCSPGHRSPQLAPRPPASPQSRPLAPPPRFMPSPGPRFPLGPRVPGPASLPPTKLPGEEFPRPFVSYEAARPFCPTLQQRTQGRFVRPLPPPPMPRIRPPMEPRVRPYGDARLYRPPPPPGYRPAAARPRYV